MRTLNDYFINKPKSKILVQHLHLLQYPDGGKVIKIITALQGAYQMRMLH